ncbi:MAG: hypothetical protein J6R79_01235 [Bacteroidaceae bacterium]|nr:hypothetical protein [Bacteroidaceae bacterium]
MSTDFKDSKLQKPEVPVIIIERDEAPTQHAFLPPNNNKRKTNFIAILIIALSVVVIGAGAFVVYRQWAYQNPRGVSISVSPAQNIQKLEQKPNRVAPQIVKTSESVLGVDFDMYAIHGLQGIIEFEEPDTADASVFLYCRSVDFTAEGRYLSSLVSNGTEYAANNHRLGYMAMVNGKNTIGISRSEEVMEYVKEQGGSYFRQFILVSDGELPPRFHLHGKVERCAIGRIGETLYYITSHHKETLWSFADALREYGFIDAIYITGGYDYSFYRDINGQRHDIHDPAKYPHKKWQGITPWLVFRTMQKGKK